MTKQDTHWYYEKLTAMGGAGGDAYKSVFNGTGTDPASTLAREAVQNSVDAARDPSGSVRVDFRFRRLAGDDRERFLRAAGLDEMATKVDRLGLFAHNCLSSPESDIELLYVEDYETTGLQGDPTNPRGNLRKLLMDLGGSESSRDEAVNGLPGSGGSYGFGKAVYSSNSKLGVIFAYSKTTDQDGNALTVLMGCAYQSEHEVDGTIYTGRAWLGRPVKCEELGLRFDPFIGSEAEEMAASLGFRRDDGLGTSILIVDTEIDPGHLIRGLEDNWWPRIQRHLLDVEVVSDVGGRFNPQPRKRRHLKPFIQAWDVANGPAPEESMERKQIQFNKMTVSDPESRAIAIGRLGLVSLREDEDDYPLGEEYDDLVNTVALVRSPMMVVKYHSTGRSQSAFSNAVGCFIADSDINGIMRLSEPPPHDDWDPFAERLRKKGYDYPSVVKSVLARIKRYFKDFQRTASPPDPFDQRRLTAVERLLAKWFVPSDRGNTPPVKSKSPIHLVPEGPHLELTDRGLVATGKIQVSISDHALEKGRSSVPIKLELALKVAEEDGVSSTDPIPFEMEVIRGDVEPAHDSSGNCHWVGSVAEGEDLKVEFRSSAYDPEWTIKMVPIVTEATTEEKS